MKRDVWRKVALKGIEPEQEVKCFEVFMPQPEQKLNSCTSIWGISRIEVELSLNQLGDSRSRRCIHEEVQGESQSTHLEVCGGWPEYKLILFRSTRATSMGEGALI